MIKSWVQELLTLNEVHWRDYSFSRDPLIEKIPVAQHAEFHQKTVQSARQMAHRLHADFGSISLEKIAKQLGVQLVYQRQDTSSGSKMFACYQEPNTITIFLENVEATDRLLVQNDLVDLVGPVQTADLLIAHELYHFLEQSQPDVFSAQKHITLWQLGPFQNRSRIFCLEEIGAMAFAQEMTGMKCSPYIFEVLMLYPQGQQKARELYEHFLKLRTAREEP